MFESQKDRASFLEFVERCAKLNAHLGYPIILYAKILKPVPAFGDHELGKAGIVLPVNNQEDKEMMGILITKLGEDGYVEDGIALVSESYVTNCDSQEEVEEVSEIEPSERPNTISAITVHFMSSKGDEFYYLPIYDNDGIKTFAKKWNYMGSDKSMGGRFFGLLKKSAFRSLLTNSLYH